jgi:hypothetical protein
MYQRHQIADLADSSARQLEMAEARLARRVMQALSQIYLSHGTKTYRGKGERRFFLCCVSNG